MPSLADLIAAKKAAAAQPQSLATEVQRPAEFPKIEPIEGATQEIQDLISKIRHLPFVGSDDIKGEMDSLQDALLANPAAVALMLPEDIGLMVTALCRVTGEELAKVKAPKEKKTKAKALTPDELAALIDGDL